MNPAGPQPSHRFGWQTVALGLATAIAYTLARSGASHGFDVYRFLPALQRGELDLPCHPLALRAAALWADLLHATGLDLHERLRVASALSTGLAAAILAGAARQLLGDSRSAWFAAATWAALPGIAWYATVMELHALYLPAAAVAIWTASRFVATQATCTVRRCLALGTATATATGLHATGHVLTMILIGLCAVEAAARGDRRSAFGFTLGTATAHAVATFAIRWLLVDPTATVDATATPWRFLDEHPATLRDLHRVLWHEWLVPFAPMSLLAAFGWFGPLARLTTVAAAGVATYLAVCQRMLAYPDLGYRFEEFGAYLQPVAFLLTVAAMPRLGPRIRWLVLVTAVAGSALCLATPGKERGDPVFGQAALARMATGSDRWLVATFAEYDGVFDLALESPHDLPALVRMVGVEQFVFEAQRRGPPTAEHLALFLHPRFAGCTTVVTTAALEQLRRQGGTFAELVEVALPALFTFAPLARDGDRPAPAAIRLEPK